MKHQPNPNPAELRALRYVRRRRAERRVDRLLLGFVTVLYAGALLLFALLAAS